MIIFQEKCFAFLCSVRTEDIMELAAVGTRLEAVE